MSDLLHTLCATPTAPFAETGVLRAVRSWAKANRLRVDEDRSGNLLVSRPMRSTRPRLVLVAHADHPGFVATGMTDRRTLRARFHGGVKRSFFMGSRVRFFDGDAEVVGRITAVDTDATGGPTGATLRVPTDVSVGSIGMWDVGGPRVRGHKFHGRVCDDLAGLAAGLDALAAADTGSKRSPAAVLVTRGEEEGFIGAIAAVENGDLLRPTDRLVSIECSAEQPVARQGDGVVVRVGDRTSVFHSAFTRFVAARAGAIGKADAAFKSQRALMPGGTCEATVFDAWGFTAAAVCVPLGNYHNMNPTTGKIAAEHVDLRDWRSLVTLLTDLCRTHGEFDGTHDALKATLSARREKFLEQIGRTAKTPRTPRRKRD